MTFDVYFPFEKKVGGESRKLPGVKSNPKTWSEIVQLMNSPLVVQIVKDCHRGMKERKLELPAICFNGRSVTGKRSASSMVPTQFVMIDIDHCENPRVAWQELSPKVQSLESNGDLIMALVHVTPSGKGLRLVFRALKALSTIPEQMTWFAETLDLSKYGDVDSAVKDLSRLSFMPMSDDLLKVNSTILSGEFVPDVNPIVSNYDPSIAEPLELKGVVSSSLGNGVVEDLELRSEVVERRPSVVKSDQTSDSLLFSAEESSKYDAYDYRGTLLSVIIAKYVEVKGKPGHTEVHNYYNDMVKNFRCICNNEKRALLYLLPRFGHTAEECWSQIVSICKVNTLSSLPKSFYFFLKDNGFYQPRGERSDDLKAFMLSDSSDDGGLPPYLPPVFRELVGCAPKDFVVPAVNALLPILGTLTSYVRAVYPYDGRVNSTSFFSVIYAPAGTGKSFVERFIDMLFVDLKMRDMVSSMRENVYLRTLQRKGANDKAPDLPHVSLRLIPPKNSEPEFLQKQQDNHGYHMFTYAAEMDSWAKGVRAAGGNKDDMIRIAWDNGEYGQQFKSFNTFKGVVRLYWNVLITGTLAQVESYFKNVENGLVSRCSFCSIENQEFIEPPSWKSISKRGLETISSFVRRCDLNSYEQPCSISLDDLQLVSDDDFDKEIDWKFKFRDFKMIDMSWLKPSLDRFHKEQIRLGALDVDRARDMFRRRVAVRGFRLGMICYCLWEKPRESDLKKCIPFIEWWMHEDIENMLKLWGSKYNEQTDVVPTIVQRTVFDSLPNDFTRSDVYSVCVKQGIRTPVRRILFDWKKLGYVEKKDKENYSKKKGYAK